MRCLQAPHGRWSFEGFCSCVPPGRDYILGAGFPGGRYAAPWAIFVASLQEASEAIDSLRQIVSEIVRVCGSKAQVLLFVPGLTLELLHRCTHGLHDIRASWGGTSDSMVHIFRYDGATYKLASRHWEGPQP